LMLSRLHWLRVKKVNPRVGRSSAGAFKLRGKKKAMKAGELAEGSIKGHIRGALV
jgi:hypothetical protein